MDKNNHMLKPFVELLAPAGSREALAAAVENGADAVYLAGHRFGARAYAENFHESDLKEAIRFAHLRNVKVHVAVNTIVDDGELGELADYLRFLYDAGADAVLVQDLGAAKLLRQAVPGMPMHASTQMTVHNLAGVLALQGMGFSRAVLSRELSLENIRYICANTSMEIEVFVHGALCICYSGQCLMSSLIGGRSGNRGRCAQPCRLPYALVDGEGRDALRDKAGRYLLSPKDLNAIDVLPQLIEAGVASLKIEGRMKRPEYVATVVDAYRCALDACARGEAHPANAEDQRALAQIFNRDFTTAYLEGTPGKRMMSDRRPNNRGLLIGRVVRCDGRRVKVKLTGELGLGDQVDIWVKVGGRATATIQELWGKDGRPRQRAGEGDEVSFSFSASAHENDRVFKIFDAALMEKARQSFRSGVPVRRIPVDATVTASVGEPLRIRLSDDDGHTAEAMTDFIGEAAQKRPLDEAAIRKPLSRLGSTVFSLRSLRVDIRGDVMVPISEINEARRKATDVLAKKRLEGFARPSLPTFRYASPMARKCQLRQSALIASVDALDKAESALKAGADGLVFGGDSYGHAAILPKHYREACRMAREQGKFIAFHTPRILDERWQKEFSAWLEAFSCCPPDEVYVQNLGTLFLVREAGLPIHADASLIAYNHLAISCLKELGARSATLSPELTLSQVEHLAKVSDLPLECIVDGRLEVMVSAYCAVGSFLGQAGTGKCTMPCRAKQGPYALKDRTNAVFPLAMDQFCHMHVLNSKKLSMLPHAMKFARMGIARMRIEGKSMTPKELFHMVQNYRKFSEWAEELLPEEKAYIQSQEGENITRGHYFRGILGCDEPVR